MPRFIPLAGLSLAALLALTACSSSPASSGPSESASSGPSESPSATSGTGAGSEETGSYSSDDLATILGTVTQADGTSLQMIPTAQIEQSMDQARQFLDAVTVTPEDCKVFVSNSLEAPEGAGVATGVSSSNGDAVQTIVSAASSAGIDSSMGLAAVPAAALEACSSFSVDAQGVVIEQTVEAVDASTKAEGTVGTSSVQSSSDGGKQQTMTIIGTRGDLAVTALRTAKDTLPDGTQDELQDLVDATFTAAERG
ncbi:MAG: hypothetical protein JWM61_2385 [Micrococcaceae bacterium]|jgi:hypothetical protein|nr:hypothetical protein [Micrococcaceae bacterium]